MSALQSLAAMALAARGSDQPAIRFAGRWHTGAEFRQVAETVGRLAEASGAAPRATTLFIARNVPAAFPAFLALIAAGRSVRMIYAFQSPTAIAADIARLKPGVVVAAEQDLADEVRAACRAGGIAVIALGNMAAHALPGLERSTAPVDPDAPAEPTIFIQTSGTTGPPKHYPVTYDMAQKFFVERMASSTAVGAAAPPPLLHYSPIANLSGMMTILPALISARQIILYDRFDLGGWREYIRTYRPAITGINPASIKMVLDANVPPEELASLRTIITGSAPLDPDVQRAFEARYGITILLSYGATEFLGTVVAMTPELHETYGKAKYGSVGRAVAGVQLRIVDADTGAEAPPGTVGVLAVRIAALKPDWIRTSDLGAIDADGFLFLHGRADGAIVRGGFKLLPETIERGLARHPAVSVAAVVGVPDTRLGQVPAAAIQFRHDVAVPTRDELETHLRREVPATHIPVHWRFVADIPRTQSQKVDRRAVAKLFEAR